MEKALTVRMCTKAVEMSEPWLGAVGAAAVPVVGTVSRALLESFLSSFSFLSFFALVGLVALAASA